jgi:hypothetical protein
MLPGVGDVITIWIGTGGGGDVRMGVGNWTMTVGGKTTLIVGSAVGN